MGDSHMAQRVDDDTLGQVYLWQLLGIEAIVDDKIEGSTQVGHIALEYVVGIYRYVQAVKV